MLKPLYIEGTPAFAVSLDGPSLVIAASEGRQKGRIPLPRLAHVITSEKAKWSTEALVACLRRGIPVVFLDAEGAAVGFCMGTGRPDPQEEMARALATFLDRPDWPFAYAAWKKGAERYAVRGALKTLERAIPDLRPSMAQKVLADRLEGLLPKPTVEALLKRLRAFLFGLVVDLLQTVGMARFIHQEPDFQPHQDLVALLLWDLKAWTVQLALEGRTLTPQTIQSLAFVQELEKRTQALWKNGRLYLHWLERNIHRMIAYHRA